jgi:DNA-binding CsgD family transcriptional regulator
VAANLHGACAAPPLLRRRSRHGEFVLKAFAMHAGVAAAEAIVVQVQRRTPVDARLFRSELFRSLTAQEQIVCRLLIKGSTQGEIARSLGVSPHTVVSHIRNIYRRTGANDRDSLKGAVLPLADAA